jgi:hypothetical protein
MSTGARATGLGLIALAVLFNLPYAVLAARFDYPGILREPPEVILSAFQAGGTGLILTWYAFALSAILFIPAALALSLRQLRVAPGLAVAAAILGALAGLSQAIGLLRWVMVVPVMAADPAQAAGFAMLHAFAGVAVGEHLGMLLTAGFVAVSALADRGPQLRRLLGAVTAVLITGGAFEGVALSLSLPGSPFGLSAIAGYLTLSLWLVWTGLSLLRGAAHPDDPAVRGIAA